MSTSLTRTSPFAGLVDQFFDGGFLGPSFGLTTKGGSGERTFLPAVDLSHDDQSYVVKVDLPGLEREDIDLTLQDQTLTLSGERKFENVEENETYSRIERSYGKFTRSFQLPSNVDNSKVTAQFENGVLTVRIPKAEEAKSRAIEIG